MTANGIEDDLEAPHPIIARKLREGGVVPFLGAGASVGARPLEHAWNGHDPAALPLGSELAEWLSRESRFPESPDDLPKIASYHQLRGGREELMLSLRRIFARPFPWLPIHDLLAEIAGQKPMLVVTTNYDDLLERAFDHHQTPYHLVTYSEREDLAGSVLWWKPGEEEPTPVAAMQLPLKIDDTAVIFKMHGTVLRSEAQHQWDSYVITEEDYVRFLSRMTLKGGMIPSRFMLHFRNSSLLFLGYGLGDWNFRVMLERLRRAADPEDLPKDDQPNAAPPPPPASQKVSWAFQSEPSRLDRFLWSSRHIQIFNQKLDDFVEDIRSELGGAGNGG
jgi:hypothetical protein